MAISYLKLHYDFAKTCKSVSDEQLGAAIRAALNYGDTGTAPDELAIEAQILFDLISTQMDRDNAAYEEKCEKNRQNVRKRWNTKGKDRMQSNTNDTTVYDRMQSNTNGYELYQEKEEEKEEEEEEDLINNIMCIPDGNARHKKTKKADINAHFEAIWKLYPRKRGKGQVSDAQKKRLYEVPFDEMQRAIERYIQELSQDAEWRQPQNGSTFFNSGYLDYLDKFYTPREKVAQNANKSVRELNEFYDMAQDWAQGG